MQNTDEREQASRGIGINVGFALKPLLQNARALIVDATPRHIYSFNLARSGRFNRVKIAFANLEVVFDHLAERAQ